MPLLEILTDPQNFKFYAGGRGSVSTANSFGQKSIPFGKDRPGGGDSGQPYITSPLVEDYLSKSPDFLLRGGLNTPLDAANDVLRLSRMFTDTKSPSGLLFTSKQQLLSRTAVRTQTSGILNEGAYSPLNTIAQAGVGFTGYHLNKQGLNPFGTPRSYYNTIKDSESNRLLELKQSIISNPKDVNVLSYSGGPGSVLGIGKTNIKFATTPFGANKTLASSPTINAQTGRLNEYNGQQLNPSTLSTQQIDSKDKVRGKVRQDFRAQLREDIISSSIISNSPNYTGEDAKNYETRTNLENPANSTRNLISYTSGSRVGPVDKINALPIYRSSAVDTSKDVNDLVKFRIAIIDNEDPTQKEFIHFRALLGSISDNYSATWNSTKYLGRGEDFYTYGGFGRTVSLSWTVAAQSKEELIPMYKKLNYLASTLAPDYSGNGYMKGNLVQLTVGGYFYEQPGFITAMNLSIQDDTPYEIGINDVGGSDNSVKELPMIIRVDGFSFTPIHNFRPQKQTLTFSSNDSITYGPERFIALANGTGSAKNNYDS